MLQRLKKRTKKQKETCYSIIFDMGCSAKILCDRQIVKQEYDMLQ